MAASGIEVVSYNRVRTAITCQHKYYVQYKLRAERSIESSWFTTGKVVHETIEDFYKEFKSIEDLPVLVNNRWKTYLDEVTVKRLAHFYDDYQDCIDKVQKNGPRVYKHPTMTTYWKDRYQGWFETRKAGDFSYVESAFKHIRFHRHIVDLYFDTRRCVDNFAFLIKRHQPLNTIDTEMVIDPPVEVHGYPLGGRIDRVEVNPDTKELRIYDYKTRKQYWTMEEIINDTQLTWYAYCAGRLLKLQPTTIGIFDLWNKSLIEVPYTDQMEQRFLGSLQQNMRYVGLIEENIKAYDQSLLPIPVGMGPRCGCPCDLIYESEEAEVDGYKIKCPWYTTLGEIQLAQLVDE